MAIVNRISEQEYRELALTDADRLWELWDGVLAGEAVDEHEARRCGVLSRVRLSAASSIDASIA